VKNGSTNFRKIEMLKYKEAIIEKLASFRKK